MRYSKSRTASTGRLNLTLGARNVIWAFLFHFSFVSSASWLVLKGVMSTTHQAVITLSRIVFSCDGWLRRAVPISRIRIIHLHEFFFISWAGSPATWVALIARSRIILNRQYIPCSLYKRVWCVTVIRVECCTLYVSLHSQSIQRGRRSNLLWSKDCIAPNLEVR